MTGSDLILWSARGVTVLWAGFWLWFGIVSSVGEPDANVVTHVAPGLAFALVALIAWKWHKTGGTLLIALAVTVAAAYPILFRSIKLETSIVVTALMAGPPLLAGLLYLHYLLRHPFMARRITP